MNAIDTNVLVYAISRDEPERAAAAAALLDSSSASTTVLLWQVACELGAVIERLRRRGTLGQNGHYVRALRERFELVLPTPRVLDTGLRLHRDQQVSYWDALLIAACVEAGVDRLYSEDLQAQPVIAGVQIVNPFTLPPG